MRYAFILGVFGLFISAQPLSGNYTIVGSSANFASNQFPSIQAAFDSLSNRGASGVVTITLPPGTSWAPTNEPTTITLRGYTCTNCRVSLILDTVVVLQKLTNATSDTRFVLRLEGNIKNLTIDGRNKFTIQNTALGSISTGTLGIVSTSSKPLVVDTLLIRGLIIQGNGRSNTFAGIYLGPDASLTTGPLLSGSSINGLQIVGNSIDFVSRPIHLRGARTILQNITITDNRIGLANAQSWAATFNIGAVHIIGGQRITILRNHITGAESGSLTTSNNVAGVRLDSCESFEIARNWIYGLRFIGNGGRGEHGIFVRLPGSFLSSSSSHLIHNNMIADILGDSRSTSMAGDGGENVSGIYLGAFGALSDARLQVYHNSIHLFGDNSSVNSTQSGGASACITVGDSIRGGVVIVGNILQNTLRVAQQPKPAYGIVFLTNSPLSSVSINYNAYYISAPAVSNYIAGIGSTNYTTFSSWQSSPLSPESNGIALSTPANFTSNTDLHLTANTPSSLINVGSPTYNGTQDIDGQTRPLPTGTSAYNDSGTFPDIGADELDGTMSGCFTSLFAPNLITSTTPDMGGAYFWGKSITLDTTGTNQPPAAGSLQIIYSLDDGNTWTSGPAVSSFPISFTLPGLVPPTYEDTIFLALRAGHVNSGCPLPPDTSNAFLQLPLRDRPGNRPTTAIPLTLNLAGGIWTASIQDSTNGLATSNEYGSGTGAPTNPRGTGARDIFFKITLPACFDSLRLNTCDPFTNFGTRINLFNQTSPDTTADEDQGSSYCSSAGFSNPQFTAHLIAIGGVGSSPIRPYDEDPNAPNIDTLRLRAGDEILIAIEGFNSGASGRFNLSITGYPTTAQTIIYQGTARPSGTVINISTSNTSVQDTFIVQGGGFQHEWRIHLNGQAIPLLTLADDSLVYTFTQAGTYQVIAQSLLCGKEDTLIVNVSFTTATHTGTSPKVFVFPNPSSGSFTVKYPAEAALLHLYIYDLTGRKVYETAIQGPQQSISTTLPNGLYRLTLVSDKVLQETPLLIQR
ncbi:MAG: T9SS type A sorting domain-containing protein [Bacteroidia bacterium]|nr:T9SS type A sorting domain-containing protein [Bacteroidia bacterium]